MTSLAERLSDVRAAIADSARAAARDPAELTTIVVTKFQPASLIRELSELGVRDFGESRHQEAEAKAAELRDLSPVWHFIGQLQSKKARAVARYSNVIHSIDRQAVVQALDVDEAPVDCFVQINLTDDTARGGAPLHGFLGVAEGVLAVPRLTLLGVMAVAPLGEDPRRAFATLRQASEDLRGLDPRARFISAGMSQDYPAAIAEGATHLRIGTAITGNRPERG